MQIAFYIIVAFVNVTLTIVIIRANKIGRLNRLLIAEIEQIARFDIFATFLFELMVKDYTRIEWEIWKPVESFYSKDILKLLDL